MRATTWWFFLLGLFVVGGICILVDMKMEYFDHDSDTQIMENFGLVSVIVGIPLIILVIILRRRFEIIRNKEVDFNSFAYYGILPALFFGFAFFGGLFGNINPNAPAPFYYGASIVLFLVGIRRLYKFLKSRQNSYHQQNEYDYSYEEKNSQQNYEEIIDELKKDKEEISRIKDLQKKYDVKESESNFCESCGKSLKQTAKFCGKCGTPVP